MTYPGGSGCQVGYAYNNAGNITSFEGAAFTYTDLVHKHAVTHLAGTQKYWYDANGNMTRRINFSLDVNYSYDAENHLTGVSGGKTATFVYDGDGNLVKTTVGSVTVAIAGDHYRTAARRVRSTTSPTACASPSGWAAGCTIYWATISVLRR